MGRKRGGIAYHIFNAAVFITLEAAAIVMLNHNGGIQSRWFFRSFHSFNARVWGCTENVKRYFRLKEENDRLAQENLELFSQLRAYEAFEEKLSAEKWFAANGPESAGGFHYTPASIVKHSLNKQRNYFILDKGSSDGIESGDGVITSKGTVGIINSTSDHYSYVMAFINSECVVSARLGLEGAIGPLSWDGISQKGALLKEIPCHLDVNPGDTVFTSGHSSIFPPDIPLGITGETKIINGATYEIKVELFEEFSEVRYVTVVSNDGRKEISNLENQ